jgi:hypothetical protein
MYKLSEDISKSAFYMNLQRKSDFPTYHVIEAKKRYVLRSLKYLKNCDAVFLLDRVI